MGIIILLFFFFLPVVMILMFIFFLLSQRIADKVVKKHFEEIRNAIGPDYEYFESSRMIRPADIGISWRLNKLIYSDVGNKIVNKDMRDRYVLFIRFFFVLVIIFISIIVLALAGGLIAKTGVHFSCCSVRAHFVSAGYAI